LAFPMGRIHFLLPHMKAQKQTQLPVQTDQKNSSGRRRCCRPSTSTSTMMTATPHFFCFGPFGLTPRGCTFWPFPCDGQNSLFITSYESPDEADATSSPDRSEKLYWAATLWPPKYQHHDDRNPTFLVLWPFWFDSPRVHFLAFPVYTTELTFYELI
jgi:hypothetical protein